ncbi:lipoyl synthase [Enteractinococcus coprophilus]|uniref:Lipoyl synthase n=2 Tax=Micrococcales TaxID=85006 RepID=A0A543AIV3_9MICC|nr:lipoyl synthase [Enteractinococcus coprophilus]TQL72505.1 lipoic acid synthetase [Enteractinococcus coprophilus]
MSTIPQAEGRKLLRIEARNAQVPREPRPEWLKTRATVGPEYKKLKEQVATTSLNTVCAEANCPNIYECWEDREASFLIGGAVCTRRCGFCDIATGKPDEYDTDEPYRVAESVDELGLNYVTVTGVARDDLEDGASWLYAETARAIHERTPHTGVELLVDDFRGGDSALQKIFDAKPEVFAHNLETVPRLMKIIRPAFRYEKSLASISKARDAGLVTKSNLILGMGETTEEIESTILDLINAGTHIITITQYLRPSPLHHPVDRWVKPAEFLRLRDFAYEHGAKAVMSGPLVRSSYRSGKLYVEAMRALGREIPPQFSHLAEGADTPARQEAESVADRFKDPNKDVAAIPAAALN